ncbi:GntR family transcriptional regulator [Pseudonocardia sp. TRM90224]|uniref:GntR family transcriptional regulator n=1 Tax=Pseudonocardia sp. TRM90224 TaxID=2812678 RepID=UPI001E3ACB3D|nr:GntR family transcriptional regulator [Pseudonocardia sp. TRM90224]
MVSAEPDEDALSDLPALPKRASTAEYAAETLRRQIADGKLRPGTQLREGAIATAFSISRNTVREAFRLLAHKRLVEHALHRGVYVREVSAAEVRELYATRRLVQPLGIDAALRDPDCVAALGERVEAGATAAAEDDWDAAGTANIDFHRVMMAGCGSDHVTAMFEQVLAELRLAFLLTTDHKGLHAPFVGANHQLLALLAAGDRDGAQAGLQRYLLDAERIVLSLLHPDPTA